MKSNKITLSDSLFCMGEVLHEADRAAAGAGLSREQAGILRGLTETALSMVSDLLDGCGGVAWMEWEGLSCAFHLEAQIPEERRDALAKKAREAAKEETPNLERTLPALLAGLLAGVDLPEFYRSMSAGLIPAGSDGRRFSPGAVSTWSLADYRKVMPEGRERTLLASADDVAVVVKDGRLKLVVKKQFDASVQAAMPKFDGLSHICIFVDDMEEAVSYYSRLLGAVPDHYLPHWKNEGFFRAGGFVNEAAQGDVSIAFVNVPGTRLTLELMQYHYPIGRKEPVFFAANDVSGARHVALKITNIDEAFLHIKAMPDTRLINESEEYRVFQISETKPQEVCFSGQSRGSLDQRNVQTAKILSQVRYFYFIDKYGLQWEFEQGHTDIGD